MDSHGDPHDNSRGKSRGDSHWDDTVRYDHDAGHHDESRRDENRHDEDRHKSRHEGHDKSHDKSHDEGHREKSHHDKSHRRDKRDKRLFRLQHPTAAAPLPPAAAAAPFPPATDVWAGFDTAGADLGAAGSWDARPDGTLLTVSLGGASSVAREAAALAGPIEPDTADDSIELDSLERKLKELESGMRRPGGMLDGGRAGLAGGNDLVPRLVGPGMVLGRGGQVVANLHVLARQAVNEGGTAALASDETPQTTLTSVVRAARELAPKPLLSEASVDAAARTFSSLHSAARTLLRAIADVRALVVKTAQAFDEQAAGAQLRGTAIVWELAAFATNDCLRRTRDLARRSVAWREMLDATLSGQWMGLGARVDALAATWTSVQTQYAHAIELACGAPVTDAGDGGLAGGSVESVEKDVSGRIEALRRQVQLFVDSWSTNEERLRKAKSDGQAHASEEAVASLDASTVQLETQLIQVENDIQTARRRIIDGQRAQLAGLSSGLTGNSQSGLATGAGAGTDSEPHDGLALANSLRASAAAEQETNALIESLYSRRRDLHGALAGAATQAEQRKASLRASAASLVLQSHARWKALGERAALDVAGLADEASLLRIHRGALMDALEREVAAEHGRVLESARAALAAGLQDGVSSAAAALEVVQVSRESALAALEASEQVLGNELFALMASSSQPGAAVIGMDAGMPQPAVRLVDATMRLAVEERLARAEVKMLHEHADALQPVADGLAAGLPRPAPPPDSVLGLSATVAA